MTELETKYQETIMQMINLQSILNVYERRDEINVAIWQFKAFITDFEVKANKLQGERKNNAIEHLKKLKEIYCIYGQLYVESNMQRVRLAKLQRENYELGLKCADLIAENEKLINTINGI